MVFIVSNKSSTISPVHLDLFDIYIFIIIIIYKLLQSSSYRNFQKCAPSWRSRLSRLTDHIRGPLRIIFQQNNKDIERDQVLSKETLQV